MVKRINLFAGIAASNPDENAIERVYRQFIINMKKEGCRYA